MNENEIKQLLEIRRCANTLINVIEEFLPAESDAFFNTSVISESAQYLMDALYASREIEPKLLEFFTDDVVSEVSEKSHEQQ